MALTHATLIDLNANELILDLDADTSITADSDDTIDFKIGGSDEIKMTTTALTPAVADGSALGTAALEWADLFLADAAVISLGADQDVTLTHVHNTGLLLNSTMALQFNDASQYINAPSATILDINATDEIELNATLVDVNANLDVSGTGVIAGALTSAAFTASGIMKTDDATEATSTTDGSLQTDGGLSVVLDAIFGDDVTLLSDAAVLKFGADAEVTLTHVHNDGLLLNTDMQLQFRDSAINIRSDADGDLDINGFLAFCLKPLTENKLSELLKLREGFIEDKIKPMILEEAVRTVNQQKLEGPVIIATATNSFVTRPIADLFKIKDLIATEFVIRDNEFTGEVDGIPCFREGKVKKVEEWVSRNGYNLSSATFYSDSFNDLPLLNKVGVAIVVDGDDKLIEQAKNNDWKCISFR
mgnify:CR=1 FL=1